MNLEVSIALAGISGMPSSIAGFGDLRRADVFRHDAGVAEIVPDWIAHLIRGRAGIAVSNILYTSPWRRPSAS